MIGELLVWLTLATPLALAGLWIFEPLRRNLPLAVIAAPLPGLALAIAGFEVTLELPWLLLEGRWGVDPLGRVFLGVTAAIWVAAGLFARPFFLADSPRTRFDLFYLLTMAGNLGVTIAQDMASFLLFFVLMSFAAYGLIVYDQHPDRRRAGRVYLVLVVVGEVLLFWAAIIMNQETGAIAFAEVGPRFASSPLCSLITGAVLLGFGIKLGVMPLHVWLPLAYRAAPMPGSAVLSGPISLTGLLGILRMVPLGEVELPGWGEACLAVGVVTAFAAALIGLLQVDAKAALAYSSISQMGLLTLGVGAALLAPEHWSTISAALVLFGVHHAVVKSGLFLGLGVARQGMASSAGRWATAALLTVTALSLSGLPLTSGMPAKLAIKSAAEHTPALWSEALHWILPLTGITTTLLIARFLWLALPARREQRGPPPTMVAAWAALAAAVIAAPLLLPLVPQVKEKWVSLAPEHLWDSFWPIALAGAVVLLAWSLRRLLPRLESLAVAEGDVVVPLTGSVNWLRQSFNEQVAARLQQMMETSYPAAVRVVSRRADRLIEFIAVRLETDLAAGLLIATLLAAMVAMML